MTYSLTAELEGVSFAPSNLSVFDSAKWLWAAAELPCSIITILYDQSHHHHAILYHKSHHQHSILYDQSHHQHSILYHQSHHHHSILYHQSHHHHSILYHQSHHHHSILYHQSYPIKGTFSVNIQNCQKITGTLALKFIFGHYFVSVKQQHFQLSIKFYVLL